MKIDRGYITITELPAGARIEQMADGYVLIEGLADATLNAKEARDIRDALNVVLSKGATSIPGLIVDGMGDSWWALPDGTYVCQGRQPSAEDAERYAKEGPGSSRGYIKETYGIRLER